LLPNDPFFPSQADLDQPGDHDIDAPEAWDISTGDPGTVVAVLDSGIDLDHPDLAPNLWVNQGETPGNGLDDDGNGFVDDVHGWDFGNNDHDPKPHAVFGPGAGRGGFRGT